MLKFYYAPAPNPVKVALFLEESGMPYTLVPVDLRKGEQHRPEFLAINPNAKAPVIDDDGVIVFDSNAILVYLAEKSRQFLPDSSPQSRAATLSWLMFVASGIGPYSGQAVHFKYYAPPFDYAVTRYLFEAKRHYAIVDAHLAKHPYMVGEAYSFVDMAVWGWARAVPFILGDEGFPTMPHLKRWFDLINARPAAGRAEALKDRHTFKTEMDEEARGHMFPGTAKAG